jgi:hypothetical protein
MSPFQHFLMHFRRGKAPMGRLGRGRACLGNRQRKRARCTLQAEELEPRQLLANWVPLGPQPQLDSAGGVIGAGEKLGGRVTSVALVQWPRGYLPTLVLGTAGGGIWRSSQLVGSGVPTWAFSNTDTVVTGINPGRGTGSGAIDVGAIATVPCSVETVYPVAARSIKLWVNTRR